MEISDRDREDMRQAGRGHLSLTSPTPLRNEPITDETIEYFHEAIAEDARAEEADTDA